MKFSVIVPSFNQESFIQQTLENLVEIKHRALSKNIIVEILIFDSESNARVQAIIKKYENQLDYVEIKKDLGQYDAINKGILKAGGDYWTWLNTDDLLEVEGFFKVVEILKANPGIDYIYGGVTYIDEKQKAIKYIGTWDISLDLLIKKEPAVFQPGSWFKMGFTRRVGLLSAFSCCFDYEYILRLLKNNAIIYKCDFPVSQFRFYSLSKTGSNTVQFIREQLIISEQYGRKWYDYLTWFSKLRLMKHLLFPRT
ncbi:MAG: glycosyltransferase [Bacteroidota bacterium]